MTEPISSNPTIQQAHAAFESHDYEGAATLCQTLLEQNPLDSDALHLLGVTFIKRRDPKQAIALIQQAIALNPSDANRHHNLGGVHRQVGDMEEAAQCFFRAIRLKPDHGEAYQALTELGRLRANDAVTCASLFQDSKHPQLAQHSNWTELIEGILRRSLPEKTASYFHFAAAKLLEQQKQYDRAFFHYSEGNRRADIDCDLRPYQDLIKNSLYVFGPEFRQQRQGWGVGSDRPIFVVGMPRSGTTLVEQILASHPNVYGAGELPDIRSIASTIPSLFQPQLPYPLCMAAIPEQVIKGYGSSYLDRLKTVAGTEPMRVVDKHPLNGLYLGLILTTFPNAKIIYLQRDARATCLSCFQQNFSNGVDFSFDLSNLGSFYRMYRRLMTHWLEYSPNQILPFSYEGLVQQPDSQVRKLLQFCELEWDANCLNFHATQRSVRTASANQVRQPIYQSSLEKWRQYETHLEPLMEALKWGDLRMGINSGT